MLMHIPIGLEEIMELLHKYYFFMTFIISNLCILNIRRLFRKYKAFFITYWPIKANLPERQRLSVIALGKM